MFAYAERAGTARHVLGASKSRVVICVMRVCENVCCGTIRHCCAAERKASGGPVGPSGGHGSRGMQRLDGGNRRKRGFGNLEAPKSQPSSCAWGVMRGHAILSSVWCRAHDDHCATGASMVLRPAPRPAQAHARRAGRTHTGPASYYCLAEPPSPPHTHTASAMSSSWPPRKVP